MSSSSEESDENLHGEGEENNAKQMDDHEKVNFEKLRSLRDKVNWEIEKERGEFFNELTNLIRNWEGPYPDVRSIFRPEEIDWLLTEEVTNFDENERSGLSIVQFLICTGYRDEPNVDEDGKPILRRTTALHWASRIDCVAVLDLFIDDIYARFDVNYIDESGHTHFHAICKHGFEQHVESFLELGYDPNLLVESTGDSPLHLALKWDNKEAALLLLENGANVNLADHNGYTPLHLISKREYCDDEHHTFVKTFFKIIKDQRRTIRVEARDNSGRTPLDWAVTSFMPEAVDEFLDHGADLSSFVFPTESYLDERFDSWFDDYWGDFKLRLASGALAVLDCLKRRGYEPHRNDAVTVMKFFVKNKVFGKLKDHEKEFVDLEKCWYNDKKYAKVMINSSLSLCDLVRLRPTEAEKRLKYLDYYEFAHSREFWSIPNLDREDDTCAAHLNEILSRRFCRQWALDCFLELTQYRLPILCCEIIIENLKNEDLCCICLATTYIL